tara:strand:- start:368 stop:1306 length:939 start_codon:yes stop_codon:yes gene_type:complete
MVQIWVENGENLVTNEKTVSRFWTGSSNDVAEVSIDVPSDQDEAISLIGLVPWILVRCTDWTMIPLENLVARSRGSQTRIAAAIDREIEISGAAFALGGGVDAILVPGRMLEEAVEFLGDRWTKEENPENPKINPTEARILSMESAGVGERVCIDLTRRINEGQGAASGSISGKLCLIHGETISSEYVPNRPFRINAGAIHSYILMADGMTKYMSELETGDEIAILSSSGSIETAIVGRLKIELRPLLVVKFEISGEEGQVVVQQAETVRFVSPKGTAVSVTDSKAGDKITVFTDDRVRHIGIALDGEMVEK